MAKNSVGETEWNNGVVSKTLNVNPRKVVLSRYCKPIRIVPMDKYAENVKQTLEENGVLENGIPFSNVTPAQRDALYKIGVKITEPTGNGKNANSMKAYKEWKRSVKEGSNDGVKFSQIDNENEKDSSKTVTDSWQKMPRSKRTVVPEESNAKVQQKLETSKNIYKDLCNSRI